MPGRFDNQIRSAIDHYGWDGVEQDELRQKLRDLQYMDQDINDYFAPEEEVDEFDQKLAMFGREDMPAPGGYMESIQESTVEWDDVPPKLQRKIMRLERGIENGEYSRADKKLIIADINKWLEPYTKTSKKSSKKEAVEKISEFEIKKKGDKWQVVGHGGDVKGTHDTEQQAKDQIAAIYASGYKKKEAAANNEKLLEGVEDIINELTNMFIDDGSLAEEDSDQFVDFLLAKDDRTLYQYKANPQIAYDAFVEETDYRFPDEAVYASLPESGGSDMTKKMDEAELFDVGELTNISAGGEYEKQMYLLGKKAADMFDNKIYAATRRIMKNKADSVNYDYNEDELDESDDFYELLSELSLAFLRGMSDDWMFPFMER